MNKNEFIAAISDHPEVVKLGMTKAAVGTVAEALLDAVRDALAAGDEVRLTGFGSFYVTTSAARQGYNPQTGAAIEIKPAKQPRFKAGKQLKDLVNDKIVADKTKKL